MILFGKDIWNIPCMKEGALYGVCGGLATGLGAFFTTSKPRFSTKVGFFGYMAVHFGYFINCRTRKLQSDLLALKEAQNHPISAKEEVDVKLVEV